MMMNFPDTQLNKEHFSKIAGAVHRLSGINLLQGKEELVKVRLSKRLRSLGLNNFEEYIKVVERDAGELARMVDFLTTNKTSFFRECQHFDFLREQVLMEMRNSDRRFRLWSAGCSSGEEPYTLAIILAEEIPNIAMRDIRILATDLSARMVARVREATYDEEALRDISPALLKRYFTTSPAKAGRSFRVCEALRDLVKTAQLNLMDPWPMTGGFDVIFCRNVMIYFDKATQARLVQRFWETLRPGGHLCVGHSESLTGMEHGFQFVRPAIYVR